jgi:hypothetical protein
MKKMLYILGSIFLIMLFLDHMPVYARGVFKWVKVGRVWAKVYDNGHQSETEGGNDVLRYDFDGHRNPERSFSRYAFRNNGTRIGVKNWTDENGTLYPVRLGGAPFGTSDAVQIMPVLPDKDGITIHRYVRYQPASIKVDGMVLNDPFPFDDGDHVDPAKTGTADVMVESKIRTWIGLDVHQKVYGLKSGAVGTAAGQVTRCVLCTITPVVTTTPPLMTLVHHGTIETRSGYMVPNMGVKQPFLLVLQTTIW